jgi:hypothetical protein
MEDIMTDESFSTMLKALRDNVYRRDMPMDIDMVLRQTMDRINESSSAPNHLTVSENVLFWAFRYCIHRQSYAVADCVDSLRKNWHLLTTATKDRICSEIREKLQSSSESMMLCDIDAWQSVLGMEHA